MNMEITSADLAGILSSINKHVADKLMEDRGYTNKFLLKLNNVKWDPEFAEQYGTDFREIVSMLKEYGNGNFRNIKDSEISNIITMFAFYTEPVHIHEMAAVANTKKIQNNIACRLIGYYRQLNLEYMTHLTNSGCLFADIIGKDSSELLWDMPQIEEDSIELREEDMGRVFVNDEEREMEQQLSTPPRNEVLEELTIEESSWF